MFSFINPIKSYLMIAGAAVVAIFIGIFKYRGMKVDQLEADVAAKDQEIEANAKLVENEKEAAQFVADNRVAKVEGEIDVEDTATYDPNTQFFI